MFARSRLTIRTRVPNFKQISRRGRARGWWRGKRAEAITRNLAGIGATAACQLGRVARRVVFGRVAAVAIRPPHRESWMPLRRLSLCGEGADPQEECNGRGR